MLIRQQPPVDKRRRSDDEARNPEVTSGSEFEESEKFHDFHALGHSTEDGQWHGGPTSRFLSNYTDSPEGREEGTKGLLDQLGASLGS